VPYLAEQWTQFARTGLTHLLSVSGLHITLVAGLVYGLCNLLWRRADFLRPALSLRMPAQAVAALGGVAGAFAYALLAGFAVPAQRTLYMVTVVALTVLLRRTMPVRQVLALALGTVLLLDPWAVLAAGFWLSFGAVALLLYVARHPVGGGHWLADWGRAQWAMTIGMLPAMLALFQQFSLRLATGQRPGDSIGQFRHYAAGAAGYASRLRVAAASRTVVGGCADGGGGLTGGQ
jgi:competence protein ComEC